MLTVGAGWSRFITQASESRFIPTLTDCFSSCRSSSGSEGDAATETQTSHQPSLQPHNDDSSAAAELPAGLTGLHQPQPATSHAFALQNALLVLSRERRADGRGVHE